jgi:transposase
MKDSNVIAIDLAKDIFQVCVMNRHNKIIFNQAFSRSKLKTWLPKQALSVIVMESCGGSSYWQRLAASLGHETKLIPPRQVKPFRTGQKTDSNDAIAIAVASQAPNIQPARCMTVEQQGLQSVERMRDMLDKQKLQISNQIRGLLMEFGILINKSVSSFKTRLPEILNDFDNELPVPMRDSLVQMWELYGRLESDFETLDQRLRQITVQDDECQRLMKLEGVGPISAIRLKLQLGHREHFKNGRQASACIGLTPKQHSSGGKARIGSVGKVSCDRPLRSCLYLGARSVVSKLKNRPAKTAKECWLKSLIERRGVNCASMALANKTVRTAYAMLKSGQEYKPMQMAA